MTNQPAPRELKPCPFCGATHPLDLEHLGVECKHCWARMPSIADWNRRAESAAPAPETPRTTDEAAAFIVGDPEEGGRELMWAHEVRDARRHWKTEPPMDPLYAAPRTMAAQPAAREWYAKVVTLAGVWPAHDVAGVPQAMIDAVAKYHSAMIAASPAAPVAQADAQDRWSSEHERGCGCELCVTHRAAIAAQADGAKA